MAGHVPGTDHSNSANRESPGPSPARFTPQNFKEPVFLENGWSGEFVSFASCQGR